MQGQGVFRGMLPGDYYRLVAGIKGFSLDTFGGLLKSNIEDAIIYCDNCCKRELLTDEQIEFCGLLIGIEQNHADAGVLEFDPDYLQYMVDKAHPALEACTG
jgi:hypothetical protein